MQTAISLVDQYYSILTWVVISLLACVAGYAGWFLHARTSSRRVDRPWSFTTRVALTIASLAIAVILVAFFAWDLQTVHDANPAWASHEQFWFNRHQRNSQWAAFIGTPFALYAMFGTWTPKS